MPPIPDDTSHPKKPLNFEFKFDPKLRILVHRDFGYYYKQRNFFLLAIKQFEEAHNLNKDDSYAIIQLSDCKLWNAECKAALKHAECGVVMDPSNPKARFQKIDCLYDDNQYEECINTTVTTMQDIPRVDTIKKCHKYLECLESTLQQSIGYNAGPCLFAARKIIKKLATQEAVKNDENIPKWKVLKEQEACDVTSHTSLVKEQLSPMDVQRRNLNFSVLNHLYFDFLTAYDIQFLKGLKENPNFILPNTTIYNSKLNQIYTLENDRVCRFKNMLRCRQPAYSKYFLMNKNEKKASQYKEGTLFRVQYQTRRDVFRQLVHIKKLSALNKLESLVDYVDNVLSNYYTIKTHRVFPRKFAFTNELCNIVGLEYLKYMKVPKNLMEAESKNRLNVLLDIPIHENREYQFKKKKFGDKSNFIDPERINQGFGEYKRKMKHLEQRLKFVKYPIENCYIYHEIARLELTQNNDVEAKIFGHRMLEVAYETGNCVWQVLSYITIIRVNVMQHNYVRVQKKIVKLKNLTQNMNETLQHYIETLSIFVENQIEYRKKLFEGHKNS